MPECVYLGRRAGSEIGENGQSLPILTCHHPDHKTTTEAACEACPDRALLPAADCSLVETLSSAPEFYKPTGSGKHDHVQVDLRDMYRGATVFACLAGPSMRHAPLGLLQQRGILIASVNNAPAALPAPLRPHIWLHTDDPRKFHDSLWRDPAILKFTPIRAWRSIGKPEHYKNIRRRTRDGFASLGPLACDMPNVIGYQRTSNFDPDTFLQEPTVNRGNCKRSARRNHRPHVINTMFALIKILYVLGCRRIYLVGADFRMVESQPYAFDQQKSAGGVGGCNSAFAKMNSMFKQMQPRLLTAGCEVYNTTQPSGLDAFPYRDLRTAVAEVSGSFEQQLDGSGWYD